MKPERLRIAPVSSWGRLPLFRAKVGTGPGTLVLIRRVREFYVGQDLKFCKHTAVEGMCKGCTPPWVSGHVYDIKGDLLFIELM
jgi:hypothetical protein